MIENFLRHFCLWFVRMPKHMEYKLDLLIGSYVRKMLPDSEIETTSNYGFKMYVSPADYISYGIYFFGDYDPRMSSVVSRLLLPGQIAIDIGAERGWFTLLFSQIVGKQGKVISFEAFDRSFKKLKRNVEVNNFFWTKCENLAISNKQNTSYFVFPNDEITHNVGRLRFCGGTGYLTDKNTKMKNTKVKTISLDHYLAKNNIKQVDLIKMDIEGSEYAAIVGAKKILKKMKPKLIVEFNRECANRSGNSVEQIYRFLRDLGYSMYTFENDHFVKLHLLEGKVNYPYDVFNVYCFPRGK